MATKPPGPGGKGLKALGGRRSLLVGGGAVAVVVVVALIKHQSANAANTAATSATNPATPTYDSSLNDIYNQFENQFEQLQSTIAGLQQTPTTGTTSSGSSTPPSFTGPVQPDVSPPSIPGATAVAPAAPAADTFTQAIYRVVGGDTLSSIAAKYGESWQEVYNYNLKPGVRPAATQATLRSRGPNLIFSNEQIDIPNK